MVELKPCPFCNGEAEEKTKNYFYPFTYIKCTECGAKSAEYHNAADARKAWNKRGGEINTKVNPNFIPPASVKKEE